MNRRVLAFPAPWYSHLDTWHPHSSTINTTLSLYNAKHEAISNDLHSALFAETPQPPPASRLLYPAWLESALHACIFITINAPSQPTRREHGSVFWQGPLPWSHFICVLTSASISLSLQDSETRLGDIYGHWPSLARRNTLISIISTVLSRF